MSIGIPSKTYVIAGQYESEMYPNPQDWMYWGSTYWGDDSTYFWELYINPLDETPAGYYAVGFRLWDPDEKNYTIDIDNIYGYTPQYDANGLNTDPDYIHVALVKKDNVLTLFVNGYASASFDASSSWWPTILSDMCVNGNTGFTQKSRIQFFGMPPEPEYNGEIVPYSITRIKEFQITDYAKYESLGEGIQAFLPDDSFIYRKGIWIYPRLDFQLQIGDDSDAWMRISGISPTLSGELEVPGTISGVFNIAPILSAVLYNMGADPGQIEISIPFLNHAYLGAYFNGNATPVELDWDHNIPMLLFEGCGTVSSVGVMSFLVPMLRTNGIGYDDAIGTMNFLVPMIERSLEGIVGANGSIDARISPIVLAMNGSPGITGNINVRIPLIESPLMMSSVGSIGFMEFSLPVPIMEAVVANGVLGTVKIIIPRLRTMFTSAEGYEGAMAFSVPMPRLFLNGMFSYDGIINISIPIISLGHGLCTLVGADGEEYAYINMVINIKNKALTEYSNYNFNSMCMFNGVSLGANTLGIYKLDGTNDNGEPINWNIRTGYIDLEMKSKKRMKQVWFSYKTNGTLMLTVILPDGEQYEYDIEGYSDDEAGTRTKVGKGIKTKYAKLDIRSIGGSTVALDAIRLHYDTLNKKR
jgi:hypothetical protein